jgi:signal transduction histidine kinase
MKLIIDGLSDYSKTHELRLEPVDIIPVIEKTIAILGYEIKKNKIVIVRNFPPENKAIAQADKNRLVQVFMNIIANAIQAIGEKGGDVSITVRQEDHEIRISITDTGPGIPRDKLQKIFDPFFTTKEAGTGLGLSITKQIIDEHHGSIYIDSRPGEETTFTVCLPRA